jgi:sugar phosphate isomerase/epimerase
LTPIGHRAVGSLLSRRAFVAASAAAMFAPRLSAAEVTIGVQSYSFRDRQRPDVIVAMQQLGLRSCELWQAHVEPQKVPREQLRRWRETVSLDEFHRIRDEFATAKIALSAYNISINDTFSDAEIERAFEMTRALGAPLITASANVNTVARIAPVAARHKMLVGMHNHSRIDPNEFATAKSLTDAMQLGPFIAVNLDIGHFTAANEDAMAFLEQHHARIVTLHIKDRKRDQGPNVEFGAGDTPIVPVLNLLAGRGWAIPANIEYEYKGGDSVAEVRKCLAYCRKALNL